MKRTILIVTPFMPYPLNSGGHIAQFEMIECIRYEYNVYLVFPLRQHQTEYLVALQNRWPNVNFSPFYYNFKSKLKGMITRRLPLKFCHILDSFFGNGKKVCKDDNEIIKNSTVFQSSSENINPEFIKHVRKVINENYFDQIQVEFFEFISLVSYLPQTIRKIFIVHEIRHIREQRELSLLYIQSDYHRFLLAKNKGFEIGFLEQYDTVVPVTKDDYNILSRQLACKKLFLSPLTIKPQIKELTSFNFNGQLVFLGGDDHFPNKQGLKWFVKECWENLKKGNQSLKLSVIGNWSLESKRFFNSYNDISFAGFVDDLGKAMKNSIFIVPINIGSGMRMKIIEAVSYGCPIVTTTIGVEGFCFKNEMDCLVADKPEDFTLQIMRLINDKSLANHLIKSAWQTLSSEHSYEKSLLMRQQLYLAV